MDQYQTLWDDKHKKFYRGSVAPDELLSHYPDVVKSSALPAVDLAAGTGAGSLYLIRQGRRVIACDYSEAALSILKKHVPEAETLRFDMTAPFPLADDCTDLILCDMGLHFFSEQVTFRILDEMRRILTPKGHAVLRLNALEDLDAKYIKNELERHYYHADDLDLRYFDEADIQHFFRDWRILSAERDQMTRYQPAREVWRILLGNNQ